MFDHETINLVISLVFARSFLFHKKKQECIPVGCVQSAAVAVYWGGGLSLWAE